MNILIEQNPGLSSENKLALPSGNSPEKYSQQNSHRKNQDQGSKWTSKSLNSLPTQTYEMDLTKIKQVKLPSNNKQTTKKSKQTDKKQQKKGGQNGQKILPLPKIKKINQKMFCITIDNQINVFYLLQEKQKNKLKTKRSFHFIKQEINSNIQFTAGNGSNYVFIGTSSELIVLEMQRKEDKYFIVERCRKQIPNLRAVTFIGEEMIVVSNQEVFQC